MTQFVRKDELDACTCAQRVRVMDEPHQSSGVLSPISRFFLA